MSFQDIILVFFLIVILLCIALFCAWFIYDYMDRRHARHTVQKFEDFISQRFPEIVSDEELGHRVSPNSERNTQG